MLNLVTLLRPGRPLLWGFALVFVVAAVSGLTRGPAAAGAGIQPIAFNHAKHVAAGMGCTDCHAGAAAAEHATIPALDVCMACHATPLTKGPEEQKLGTFAAAGTEPDWRPVTQLPSHVFFSHRRHVSLGGLACETCHGAMKNLTAPPHAPLRPLTMQACIDCHKESKAGSECNDCHR